MDRVSGPPWQQDSDAAQRPARCPYEARRLEDEHWDAVRKQLDEFDKVRWYSLEGYRDKDGAEARAGLVRKRTQSVSARDIREAAGENRA
jgi:hypothetical protein